MPARCNGQSFVDAARVADLGQGSAGRVGRRRLGQRQSPPFTPDLLAPESDSARPAGLAYSARPLAPSASRWNYYSESDKPAFISVRFDPSPLSFFPPSLRVALPFPRRAAGGGRLQPGRGSRRGCCSRKKRSRGVSRRRRPLPIKGRWAGIRGRGSFFSPPFLPFGNPGGAIVRRRGGGRRLSL